MKADINLLLPKDEKTLRRQKRIRLLNLLATICLLATGISAFAIFLLIKGVDASSIKGEQENVLEEISKFQARQAKLLVVENRVNNLKEILDKKKDLSVAINGLFKSIPSGLSVDSMEIDNSSVAISAKSPSLSAIGEFINNLTDMVRQKEIISSLTISSLVFDQNSSFYQIAIKSDM